MSNASWLSKWARSPRQDRRVIEDGKFVELGKIHDETIVEEKIEVNTALEVVHESAEEQKGSAEANVLPDTQDRSSATGPESSGDSTNANSRTSVGTVEEVSNPSVSTTEGPSVSEASQAELEPLDAVKVHQKGSQTIAEIADAIASKRNVTKNPALGAPYDLSTAVAMQDLPDDWKFLSPDEVPAESVIVGKLHDETLTEEQSDALAETLRPPKSTEYDIEARLDQEDDAAKTDQS